MVKLSHAAHPLAGLRRTTGFALIVGLLISAFASTGQLPSFRDRVHALAVAGGVHQLASSRYGLVLLIKITIFGLILLMGNEGRKYVARAAFRQSHLRPDGPVRAGGISTLAVVMGAKLCIAFLILSTTALLVMVAPHP